MRPALEPAQLPRYARVGLVGSAGLEPATSRVSGERSHPVSYEPAEDGGVEPHGPFDRHELSGPVAAPAAHLPGKIRFPVNPVSGESGEESGGHDPQRLARPAAFGAAPTTLAGSLSMELQQAEDGEIESLRRLTPTRFPGGDRTSRLHPPCEESERLERYGVTRAVVSSDAQYPDWFTLHGALGGSRTLTPCGTGSWDRRVCQVPPQAHASG